MATKVTWIIKHVGTSLHICRHTHSSDLVFVIHVHVVFSIIFSEVLLTVAILCQVCPIKHIWLLVTILFYHVLEHLGQIVLLSVGTHATTYRLLAGNLTHQLLVDLILNILLTLVREILLTTLLIILHVQQILKILQYFRLWSLHITALKV